MTTTFTPEQKLTLIKHLAGGKEAELVATIMRTTKAEVIEIARSHGYPDTDKLAWAADVLAKNIEEADALPERPMAAGEIESPRSAGVTIPASAQPIHPPSSDTTLGTLNTAKGHSSKRIQAAANKAIDAIAKVRDLLAEDEQKHSAKRKAEAEKAAARAEVDRLEKQLAAAKAKLRGGKTPTVSKPAAEGGEFTCDACPRTFASPTGVAIHKGRAHTEAAA